MGKIFLLVALGAILALAVWWSGTIWLDYGDTPLSTDGTIALWLGIVVSLVVGVGLMVLLFQSGRRGFDTNIEFENLEPHHKADPSPPTKADDTPTDPRQL